MKRNYPLSFGAAVLALTAAFALTLMGCTTTIQDTYKSIAAKKPVALQTLEKELADAHPIYAQVLMQCLLESGGGDGAWDESNTIPALRLLISKGADANHERSTSGYGIKESGLTFLYIAINTPRYKPDWSNSLLYEIVKFLLENGADPSIPRTYSEGSLYSISFPITNKRVRNNEALQALLVEYGSPDLATAQKKETDAFVPASRARAASSGSSGSASEPSAGGSSTASAFKGGKYVLSGANPGDANMVFVDFSKSVDLNMGYSQEAKGSYSVSGNTLTIKWSIVYNEHARGNMQGKTFVYTLSGDGTSFSGNGVTYIRQ